MVFTGISRASAITKASNNWLNPLPLRAQGTGTCPVLPHVLQETRGNRGVDESLVLEEAQMFPRPGPRVMDRLISRAAGRAGKPAAGLEADLEVDLLCLGIEAHVRDAPRHLQAKRHREQTRLGPHGASPSPNLWERYSTLEHRRRKQIRRVWRCDVFGLRARRASPRDHNIWGCPANSTPDINPHKSGQAN